jgi:CubicO group peptidase (beta-lactamase class C family)
MVCRFEGPGAQSAGHENTKYRIASNLKLVMTTAMMKAV